MKCKLVIYKNDRNKPKDIIEIKDHNKDGKRFECYLPKLDIKFRLSKGCQHFSNNETINYSIYLYVGNVLIKTGMEVGKHKIHNKWTAKARGCRKLESDKFIAVAKMFYSLKQ